MDVLSALGELARPEQNYQQAQIFYEEGLLLARELGAEYGIAVFLQGLGYVSLHYRDYPRATEFLNKSLQYWQKQNMRQRMAGNLAGLAGVAVALGEMETAAQLLGKVDTVMKERDSTCCHLINWNTNTVFALPASIWARNDIGLFRQKLMT